jgi:hypothetical protein
MKISTQTEHSKCKYIYITKTHTHITKHMKLKQTYYKKSNKIVTHT